MPLAIHLSAGQAHESRYLKPLLRAVRIRRPHRGRPRSRPERLAGDRGYSFAHLRAWLARHHIARVIPERGDQKDHHRGPALRFDPAQYRRRNVIERCVGWLKEARRIATRYEKLAVHFLGVLKLAMIEKHLHAVLSDTP